MLPESTIICDYCHKRFRLLAKVDVIEGGEVRYFVCANCQHRYDVLFITNEGLRLRADLDDVLEKLAYSNSIRLKKRRDRLLRLYKAEVHDVY